MSNKTDNIKYNNNNNMDHNNKNNGGKRILPPHLLCVVEGD